ncbi:MAG: NfeD family protein, partial [Gammaproteobacteria bacterium]|nr:NfeD family protein [Gammaproteobacteria bacterium]
ASDHPTLNRRGEQYVGRTFTLDEPIVNGMGKIRVDDSTWKISGNDCDSGSKVKVTGIEGTIFKVECE